MYNEIITYRLAEGVNEQAFLKVCADVYETWMSQQKGMLGWVIQSDGAGEYIDIVKWTNAEASAAAQANFGQLGADHPWLACYEMKTVVTKKVNVLATFT